MKRSTSYEAWHSPPARATERSHFSGVYWSCRRSAAAGSSSASRGERLSSTRAPIQSFTRAVPRAGLFVCPLSDSNSRSHCAWLAFYGAGSIAVQFNHSRPPSPMAPVEWPHFCELRRGDRNFGARDDLRHAGYRRNKSGGGDDIVRHVLSIRAVQGV